MRCAWWCVLSRRRSRCPACEDLRDNRPFRHERRRLGVVWLTHSPLRTPSTTPPGSPQRASLTSHACRGCATPWASAVYAGGRGRDADERADAGRRASMPARSRASSKNTSKHRLGVSHLELDGDGVTGSSRCRRRQSEPCASRRNASRASGGHLRARSDRCATRLPHGRDGASGRRAIGRSNSHRPRPPRVDSVATAAASASSITAQSRRPARDVCRLLHHSEPSPRGRSRQDILAAHALRA